jgi:hypothetical protein
LNILTLYKVYYQWNKNFKEMTDFVKMCYGVRENFQKQLSYIENQISKTSSIIRYASSECVDYYQNFLKNLIRERDELEIKLRCINREMLYGGPELQLFIVPPYPREPIEQSNLLEPLEPKKLEIPIKEEEDYY